MNTAEAVSEQTEQRALNAVGSHSLQAEAIAWAYCVSDVFQEPKTFIDRLRITDEDKRRIQSSLKDVEAVLVVSYWTSERKPEPLSGGGKHYAFVVHPETYAVLHAGVGNWRS